MAKDLFKTAPTSKKAEPKEPTELKIGRDLDILAAADVISKAAETIEEKYGSRIRNTMLTHFTRTGTKLDKRPTNVKGLGLRWAEASLELKKRDVRRVLNPTELAALQKAGVPTQKKVVTEEHYYFNEELLADPAIRAKINTALSLIDFGGKDPILKQEEVSVQIVTDESLEQAFVGKTPKQAEELIALVGTLAIKPKFNGTVADAVAVLYGAGVEL